MNGMHKNNTTHFPNDHNDSCTHITQTNYQLCKHPKATLQIMKRCSTSLGLGITYGFRPWAKMKSSQRKQSRLKGLVKRVKHSKQGGNLAYGT